MTTAIWKAFRLYMERDRDYDPSILIPKQPIKHEKLCEELPSDGCTFRSEYMGCIPVENPSGGKVNNAAIKRIMKMTRMKSNKNMKTALLSIMPNMITINPIDPNQSNSKKNKKHDDFEPIKINLSRVSYCFVDSTYDRIVAFVATNENGCHECHAFMAEKRKESRMIAMAISKAFTNAYEKMATENDQKTKPKPSNDDCETLTNELINPLSEQQSSNQTEEKEKSLIDFSSP